MRRWQLPPFLLLCTVVKACLYDSTMLTKSHTVFVLKGVKQNSNSKEIQNGLLYFMSLSSKWLPRAPAPGLQSQSNISGCYPTYYYLSLCCVQLLAGWGRRQKQHSCCFSPANRASASIQGGYSVSLLFLHSGEGGHSASLQLLSSSQHRGSILSKVFTMIHLNQLIRLDLGLPPCILLQIYFQTFDINNILFIAANSFQSLQVCILEK